MSLCGGGYAHGSNWKCPNSKNGRLVGTATFSRGAFEKPPKGGKVRPLVWGSRGALSKVSAEADKQCFFLTPKLRKRGFVGQQPDGALARYCQSHANFCLLTFAKYSFWL